MSNEMDREAFRARVDEAVRRTKGRARWTMVGLNIVLCIYMIIGDLATAHPKYNPAYLVIVPAVGWVITLCLQGLSAALGPGEAIDAQDAARSRSVRRWRVFAAGLAGVVWLLAALITFLLQPGAISFPFVWLPILVWGSILLGSFGGLILYDQGRFDRALRERSIQTLIARERLDELYADSVEKPKRTTRRPAPLTGDDGELSDLKSTEHVANTRQR